MTEIARFVENSLFAPSEPFFGETQTSQKGRKKGAKWKIWEAIFAGLELSGCHKNLSEPIRINRSQSELIGLIPINPICSDKLILRYTIIHFDTLRYTLIHFDTFRYSLIHFDTLRYSLIHFNTLGYVTIQFNTLRYSLIHFDTLGYVTIHFNTLRYTLIRYDTV